MVLFADVGGVDGVRSTLSSVKIPPDVIDQIVKFLDAMSRGFDLDNFTPVKGDWFGTSGSAADLGVHTDKAHDKINNALLEAILGIQDTLEAITIFGKEFTASDGDSDAAAKALLLRTQRNVNQMDGDRNTPAHAHAPGSDH